MITSEISFNGYGNYIVNIEEAESKVRVNRLSDEKRVLEETYTTMMIGEKDVNDYVPDGLKTTALIEVSSNQYIFLGKKIYYIRTIRG
jgi:hypothetical protein